MKEFFQELRRAREERQITLQQISEATLINMRFLEAIEDGNTSILPQAYVRAFIREYAAVVGLDPADVMTRYDQLLRKPSEPPDVIPAGEEQLPPQETPPPLLEEKPHVTPMAARAITVFLLVIAAVLVFLSLRNGKRETPPQEIPFKSMVEETEGRSGPSSSLPPPTQPPATSAPRDTMTLFATTTDSVWVQVVVDQQAPREYIFPPGRRPSWRARDRFLITLGNAGAMEFTLNQKSLGVLGKPGAVVRNVEITRTMLNTR